MATATVAISPATLTVSSSSGHSSRMRINQRRRRVNYLNGLNSFSGLKADSSVAWLGLPVCTERSFAKIVSSLKRRSGGGALSSTCNAIGEIFTIAAIINGLVLVGVAVGFVLLRIEAFVEESED